MDHRRNQRENKKEYLETYENENIMVQTYQIQQKLLRRKVIAIQADLKKQEKSQINILSLHLKQLEKEHTKSKISRRKEITKIRAEINGRQ